jgi:hypothetical protein
VSETRDQDTFSSGHNNSETTFHPPWSDVGEPEPSVPPSPFGQWWNHQTGQDTQHATLSSQHVQPNAVTDAKAGPAAAAPSRHHATGTGRHRHPTTARTDPQSQGPESQSPQSPLTWSIVVTLTRLRAGGSRRRATSSVSGC